MSISRQLLILTLIFVLTPLGAFAQEDDGLRRAVEFEWDPVEDATRYDLRITRILSDGKRNKPFKFKVDEAKWKGDINPGRYEMRLRSIDDRGVPGEWSEPSEFWVKIPPPKVLFPEHEAQVVSADDDEHDLNLKWEDFSQAENYRVEIESEDKKYSKVFTSDEKTLEVSLPVAKKYYWRVSALMGDGSSGEVSEEWDEFDLIARPLETPDIEKPYSKFVTKIEWEKVKRAKTYKVQIFRKKKGKWKLVEEKEGLTATSSPFDLSRPSGKYRAYVQAFAPYTQPSKVGKIQFKAAGNLRTPAAVEKAILKDSLEKPTKWYGIASYFITQMNYQGQEHNSSGGLQAAVDPVGGTGRLGIGYQNPRRKYGYFAVADLSGFNIGAENYTFASAELHYTYEPWKKKTGNSYQSKFTGGVHMKELPLLIPTSTGEFDGVEKVTQQGVHAGFRFWQPVTEKLGYQINARLYYNIMGAANGAKEFESSAAFQAGLLGSYRLTKGIMGLAGYAYRADEANFTPETCGGSECTQGEQSSVTVQGHYLNLILEISF